jgi:hypothetical protein
MISKQGYTYLLIGQNQIRASAVGRPQPDLRQLISLLSQFDLPFG